MQGCFFTEDLYLIFVGAMVQSEDKRIITVNQIIDVGVFKQVSDGDHQVKKSELHVSSLQVYLITFEALLKDTHRPPPRFVKRLVKTIIAWRTQFCNQDSEQKK